MLVHRGIAAERRLSVAAAAAACLPCSVLTAEADRAVARVVAAINFGAAAAAAAAAIGRGGATEASDEGPVSRGAPLVE